MELYGRTSSSSSVQFGSAQAPIHLEPGIDQAVGPNINTSAWERAKICAGS
ncbi:MAG: hypothetical protein OJF50_002790 [Nitrospira sp.]|nr:hypothetical protein [Nitrospira sp.]